MRTDAMDSTEPPTIPEPAPPRVDPDRSGTADGAARPTFSVVIPTHARPELLAEAVASVIAQTREDWECLVVDDGSGTDFAPDDPRVRVIRRERSGGPAAARNTGIEAARGEVVAFLDDDDRYTPDRLALAARGLEHGDVALCFTRWFDDPADTASDASVSEDGGGRRLDGDVADRILDATTPHLGATAVRAERLVRFDETYRAVEDVEWWLRLAPGARVATVPVVGCELRRHEGVRANDTDVAGRIHASAQLLADHEEYFRAHPSARAFRLARMGLLALSLGDRREARRACLRSLRARPNGLAARGLARSVVAGR
jgi:glycosyltransferase involved in cell wall biosynthesis